MICEKNEQEERLFVDMTAKWPAFRKLTESDFENSETRSLIVSITGNKAYYSRKRTEIPPSNMEICTEDDLDDMKIGLRHLLFADDLETFSREELVKIDLVGDSVVDSKISNEKS